MREKTGTRRRAEVPVAKEGAVIKYVEPKAKALFLSFYNSCRKEMDGQDQGQAKTMRTAPGNVFIPCLAT
ncbi:hypothetical protein V6N11_004947 [Hibiscus sabdariffa]|uniref:Uncharacterized protein n=1 Tax=Hibiscus sabdariffa TaxID=183260 RepID=A0ABR2SI09_9ROSI